MLVEHNLTSNNMMKVLKENHSLHSRKDLMENRWTKITWIFKLNEF